MSATDKDSLAPQLLQLICQSIASDGHERYMPQGEVLEQCLAVLANAEKEVLVRIVRQLKEISANVDARLIIAKAQGKL